MRGLRTQHPAFPPPASVRVQRLRRCHPGLTKKRVELVPWSTAPTNGPKTAFFAAAMEIGQLQVEELNTTGLRGDCGGLRRAEYGQPRVKQHAPAEGYRAAPRQPLYPRRAASPRLSGSGPAPARIPQGFGGRGKGGAVFPFCQ